MTDDDKNKVDQSTKDESEQDADGPNDAIPFGDFLENTPASPEEQKAKCQT